MKVLTLTQPWATLVAIGAKRFETRSWRTQYRGPLIIHAAKGYQAADQHYADSNPFVAKALCRVGIGGTDLKRLPLGQLVAAVLLEDVSPTSEQLRLQHPHAEESFGDYSLGRYEWALVNPLPFPEEWQKPYTGRLGLRDFDDPDLLLWLVSQRWPQEWRDSLVPPWTLDRATELHELQR